MKWKIGAAVAAALVLVIAGTLYYIAGTPQYSLYLIRKAVRERDVATFDQHFDVTRVISNTVDRAVAVGGIPAGPQIVSKKASDQLYPSARKLIRARLDERLDDPSSLPLLAMSLDSVTYRNSAAIVTLKDPNDGSTTAITMTQLPNRHWKIVDVDLARANVTFTLDEVRKLAEKETPSFPNVPGQLTPPQSDAFGSP